MRHAHWTLKVICQIKTHEMYFIILIYHMMIHVISLGQCQHFVTMITVSGEWTGEQAVRSRERIHIRGSHQGEEVSRGVDTQTSGEIWTHRSQSSRHQVSDQWSTSDQSSTVHVSESSSTRYSASWSPPPRMQPSNSGTSRLETTRGRWRVTQTVFRLVSTMTSSSRTASDCAAGKRC